MRIYIVLFFLLVIAWNSADGDGIDSRISLQACLEHRVQALVHRVDPLAVVVVRVTPKKIEASLPETPFTVEGLTLPSMDGEVRLAQIIISIFTSQDSIPTSVLDMVRQMAAGYAPLSLRVQALPDELRPRRVVANTIVSSPRTGWVSRLKSILQRKAVIAGTIVALGGLFLISFWVFLFLGNRRARELRLSISEGLTSQLNRFENGTGEGDIVRVSSFGPDFLEPLRDGTHLLAGFTEESLSALLHDCYWGEFDRYAHFLWKRISREQKSKLLASSDLLREYIAYCLPLSESNLGAEQEPYYLNPLKLSHVNNSQLADIVKRNPKLLFSLSSLRRAGLTLTTKEKLELYQKARLSNEINVTPNFSRYPQSPKRLLAPRVEMTIGSEEEEKELFWVVKDSVELIEQVPSLLWLLKIPESRRREILSAFTPSELATAWIGPRDMLQRLEHLLPRERRQLLQQFSKTMQPSRTSPVFRRLHEAMVRELKIVSRTSRQELRAA